MEFGLKWLHAFISSFVIADQFAVRPTGSIDAALISMTHSVCYQLETSNYVRCLTKELYDIVRRISGNYRQCNKPIRDRNGTLLTTHDAQMDR